MPETLARPTGLRADAARNRARLLKVARRHHAQTGQLPLNSIAAEAGVGIGTAYRHFPSQESLVEALAMDALDRLLDAVKHAIAANDPERAFRAMVTTAYEHLCDDTALTALLAGGTFTCADAAAVAGELFADVDILLRRARESGALRAEIDVDDLRRLLCGFSAAATAGPVPLGKDRERYVEVLLGGLRP
ncbi:MAG: helix-turn-helix domain-containing protein [Microbacterium sp.]|uniref:TetR/AcrR family transcriptional regulator n=1 Tax=Microbacterium sp. TaxID=51671 RepID=UPI0039E2D675